jgi:hypothetical protein
MRLQYGYKTIVRRLYCDCTEIVQRFRSDCVAIAIRSQSDCYTVTQRLYCDCTAVVQCCADALHCAALRCAALLCASSRCMISLLHSLFFSYFFFTLSVAAKVQFIKRKEPKDWIDVSTPSTYPEDFKVK